jgi:uncharacterized protein YndB with AHSA1/START domain
MTYDLRAERILDARPEEVFDTFTDVDADKTLFANGPDWAVEVDCDLRVGGRWNLTMRPPGAEPFRESNLFTQIDRPRRLDFQSTLTMPDGSCVDRQVEVTFDDASGGTRMTVVQKGFPTAELRDLVCAGVSGMLDHLERLVKVQAPG